MLDIVKERRFMQITIALLVVLNLALIFSMFIHNQRPPGPPGQGGGESFLRDELELTPDQVAKFEMIRSQHFESTSPLVRDLSDSLDLLISGAFDPRMDVNRAIKLAQNAGKMHTELDLALYDHFGRLSQICTPEQQKRLMELASEMTRGGPPPPSHNERGRDRPPPPRRP